MIIDVLNRQQDITKEKTYRAMVDKVYKLYMFEQSKGIPMDVFGKLKHRKFHDYPDYENFRYFLKAQTTIVNSQILTGDTFIDKWWVPDAFFNCRLYNNPDFPVYALDKELLNLFINTDIPSNLRDIKRVFIDCVVFLPKGLIKFRRPSGVYLDINWVVINDLTREDAKIANTQFSDFLGKLYRGHHGDEVQFIMEDNDRTLSYTFNAAGFLYNCYFNIDSKGSIVKPLEPPNYNGSSTVDLEKLITHILLFLQCPNHDENRQLNLPQSTTRLSRKEKRKQEKLLLYKLLSINHEIKTNTTKNNKRPTEHASPITHWRRGHWRNQPCGEKLQDSKIIWIQPTLINSTQE